MVTAAIIKQYAPELASVSDPMIGLYIDLAKDNVAESVWQEKYDRAVAMLTCHYLTMRGRAASGGAGPVTSKKVGDLQISYGQVQGYMSDATLSSTEYGMIYLHMRRGLVITPIVGGDTTVITGDC